MEFNRDDITLLLISILFGYSNMTDKFISGSIVLVAIIVLFNHMNFGRFLIIYLFGVCIGAILFSLDKRCNIY